MTANNFFCVKNIPVGKKSLHIQHLDGIFINFFFLPQIVKPNIMSTAPLRFVVLCSDVIIVIVAFSHSRCCYVFGLNGFPAKTLIHLELYIVYCVAQLILMVLPLSHAKFLMIGHHGSSCNLWNIHHSIWSSYILYTCFT